MDLSKAISEMSAWEMTIRSIVTFLILFLVTRIMGKKQLSQLSYFHYVTGITIGSIAGEISAHTDANFLDGLIAIIWWFILTMLMSYVLMYSKRARKLLDDEPTIIIKEGVILERSLKSLRLHIDDVMMMLREQSIFSLKEVDWAIMENTGNLSVLKKIDQLEATRTDVKATMTEPKYFPTDIISDGKLIHDNLVELDLTEEWVLKKLRKKNIHHVKDVFYAQVQSDGSLFIGERRDE